MTYIGRYAPSPTGPLHFGSLVAAVGSWLDARAQGGRWLLRMENLDPPREMPGAADRILRTLEAFGLEWDGPVLYQSLRLDAYAAAEVQLTDMAAAFPCACTRSEIADSSVHGLEGPIYPGTCRHGLTPDREARALRLKAPDEAISFEDGLQGTVTQNLARDIGDFIIRRADGCHAYQLAVVVDDAHQGVTHVVRGADLLFSTPRQLLLQRLLGLPRPHHLHLPIALNQAGEKLSKQTQARPVEGTDPVQTLWQTLAFLCQEPPEALKDASIEELRAWALAHWRREPLQGISSRIID
ncbi:MAG TPA: tRNA glutamyl-Q(34) synthetase GluQRS [Gammaproteobacteria bacterium]|jgi:glutamyl-Q tRNA(Asp) synthetase|nr:tRNA glutamyl-Q(34) synthetase GluQRS [Gammaproteobacteria bacterium]